MIDQLAEPRTVQPNGPFRGLVFVFLPSMAAWVLIILMVIAFVF